MPKNYVPADDGLATDAFLKVGQHLAALSSDVAELKSRPVGGGTPGGLTITDNGDGTATLTVAAGGTATLTDNGDGTATLTI